MGSLVDDESDSKKLKYYSCTIFQFPHIKKMITFGGKKD